MRSSQCAAELFEFRILGLGGDEDGDVWVSIFPESEEILIGRLGFDGFALHGVGAAKAEVGECACRTISQQPAMVENFLELGSGGPARPCASLKSLCAGAPV